MNGQKVVYDILKELKISFEYHQHPATPTIEEAIKHWKNLDAAHCKNIFFRNHKGNKHYLVILDYRKALNIKDLEKRLKQGKLSFASEKRMRKYLNLKPGSVSPFGLINDKENHVHVFLDKNLLEAEKISFHPNLNTASLILSKDDFLRYMEWTGNSYEFLDLY